MVHKRKCNVGKLVHPHYQQLVDGLCKDKNYIAVEPDVSALKVLENCQAVISQPFTSTVTLGSNMGKPSIYYDPSNNIQKDDRAAHGIRIVCGLSELRRWLKETFREENIADRSVDTSSFVF